MAASFHSGDQVNAIVADIGSYSTKIGWAGDAFPKSYFRSNVAALRADAEEADESSAMSDSGSRQAPPPRRQITKLNYDYYTRPIEKENQNDGNWEIVNPVNLTNGLYYDGTGVRGATVGAKTSANANADSLSTAASGADWDDLLQLFLQHGYDSALNAKLSDHPILLAERSYNPPPIRQQTLECLFETLDVPAAFLAKDAVLSCYGCGRTTATVVDVGYSGTTVTPVYEGYVELKGVRRSPAGLRAVDEMILETLDGLTKDKKPVMPLYQVRSLQQRQQLKDKKGDEKMTSILRRASAFHEAARMHVALDCREAGAGAGINTAPTNAAFQAPHKPYELPDGTIVDVPSNDRFAAGNVLFGPDDDPACAKKREGLLGNLKKDWNDLLQQGTAEEGGEGGAGDENEDDQKYSAAASVGISKRRTARGGGVAKGEKQTDPPTAAASAKTLPPFSNRLLQKACIPYLTTLMEQHLTASSIGSMVCDAAYKCDRDQQAALLGNVIIGGGGACLGPTEQAVPDHVREQIEGIIHAHTPGWRVKALAPGLQERPILSWLGGSILGSLGTFHEMWITKAEYEEWGAAIVNRKCP